MQLTTEIRNVRSRYFFANSWQLARSTLSVLTDNPPKIFALDDAPRAELARLCRQICLTRESNPAPATSVDSELSSALFSVRETYGLTSVSEDDLIEIFRLEQERVAN